MTIGIAINGEGMGHASRCTCLARELQQSHRVVVWAPRSVLGFLREHLPEVEFHHLPLLALSKKRHRICMVPTIARNAALVLSLPRVVRKLKRQLKRSGVDGVVSDFEPFLSRAGIRLGLPVVSFCHQAVLDRFPDFSPAGIAARLVNRFMIPARVTRTISSSFFDGDVGPLIRRELLSHPRRDDGHIVVYASRSIREELLPALKANPGFDYRLFPDPSKDYISELATAGAIIAPAGHQTLSEALCLNKPVLTFPQPGQNEQELNALMAVRSGRAMLGRIETVVEDVAVFLDALDGFPFALPDPNVRFLMHDDTERAAWIIQRALKPRPAAEGARRAARQRSTDPVKPAASF
ncbi:MAG: hypothetical protein EA384_16735 [Spirochaetaceae bacterium]|nr:MAG: hypothetical protein EA384_16735 [Spirochaetaceae bacterium]